MISSTNALCFADYAVVACFFVVMISVGVFFGRKQKSMTQFFGGGRQVPWWLSGISLLHVQLQRTGICDVFGAGLSIRLAAYHHQLV